MKISLSVEQDSGNYVPKDLFGTLPLRSFVNKVLLEYSHAYLVK